MNAGNMPNSSLTATALSVEDLARLLSRSGGKLVTVEVIRQDIEEGAPVNADGTVNLIHYAAWLVATSSQTLDFRLSALGKETERSDEVPKVPSPKSKAVKPEASHGD